MRQLTPPTVNLRTMAYEKFAGIDTSRDRTAMETGENQALIGLRNGYCDWRGQIVIDPQASIRVPGVNNVIKHVRFVSRSTCAWFEMAPNGIKFNTESGHSMEEVYPSIASITTTVFNKRLHVFSKTFPTWVYDGAKWYLNQSNHIQNMRPGFGAVVGRRLIVAGVAGNETRFYASQVDSGEIFNEDQAKDSTNVLKAAYFDVANILGTADEITGLASFEQERLAVFTNDRTLIYITDPDIEQWRLDENANINVGCLSHNTIVSAGREVIFCSRAGVHAVQRSDQNGILIFSVPLSDDVRDLYQSLIRSVENPKDISAVFDQDERQYHIFFPQPGNKLSKRLTLTIDVREQVNRWSTGDFLNARCGDFLAGNLVFGTSGGLFNIAKFATTGSFSPQMVVTTPILYHGALDTPKQAFELLIQVSGFGKLNIEAYDERSSLLQATDHDIDDSPDDNNFPDVPLQRFIKIPFQRRYLGVQFKFTMTGSQIRMVGFAIRIRKE